MNELGAVWGAKERLMMLADNIGQLTAAATRTNAMRMWATLVFTSTSNQQQWHNHNGIRCYVLSCFVKQLKRGIIHQKGKHCRHRDNPNENSFAE